MRHGWVSGPAGAAVDHEQLAGQVAGCGGGEERHERGDLLRATGSSDWCREAHRQLVHGRRRRGDPARRHRVHGDPAFGHFECHGAGQPHERGLGSVVGDVAAVGHDRTGHRRHDDDPAVPCLQHGRQRGSGHGHHGVEVARDRPLPRVVAQPYEVTRGVRVGHRRHARVVHQDVEPTERVEGESYQGWRGVGRREVTRQRHHTSTVGLDLGGSLVDPVRGRGQHERHTARGEGLGTGEPDAVLAAGAGDHCDGCGVQRSSAPRCMGVSRTIPDRPDRRARRCRPSTVPWANLDQVTDG